MSQFAQLRDMGCQAGQGYHMSRPLSTAGIDELLRTRPPEGRQLRVAGGSAQVIQLH